MPVYFATETDKTVELLESLTGSEEAAGKGTATQGKRKSQFIGFTSARFAFVLGMQLSANDCRV